MKVFTIILILFFNFSVEICFADNNNKLLLKMKEFLIETLKENYNSDSDDQLFLHFFSDYQKNEGQIHLVINNKELEAINNILFSDSIYYTYYHGLVFAKTTKEFEMARNENKRAIIFGPNKKPKSPTKFGIYVSSKYILSIKNNLNNEAIANITEYYQYTGLISYFIVSDSFLQCPKCIQEQGSQEFITILFWKFLCDIAECEFYK